ncbi:hypothetical protein FRB90_001427 [Tulasnella sp. 427]|nr:hypothetical protein FRB90_001427 [Tulasnella sp. 427]
MADGTHIIFSIHGKGLKLSTKADIEPYLDVLKAMPDVEVVRFGGNTLGIEACQALAPVLRTLSKLKKADFADIFTGRLISEIPEALSAICAALLELESLTELDLSDNAFGGRSADPMVQFLTNHRGLEVLRLSNNGLGPIGGNIVANALLASGKLYQEAGVTSKLHTVICSRNRLEKGSAEAWAAAYQAHGTLVEVRMFGNDIKHEGIPALVKGLSHCKDMQRLDLQDNTLTEEGSRAVATALTAWPNLRELNLSDCLLRPKGGIALATALETGTTPKLEILKLQYNDIDKRGLTILAKAIRNHLSRLHTLELNGNRADPEDDCITSIRDALNDHSHPDALDELDDMEEVSDADAEDEGADSASELVGTKEGSQDDQEVDDLAKVLVKTGLNAQP